jgi:hypothetical protein
MVTIVKAYNYSPNMGAAVNHPLSDDVMRKSHVAAGSTKETMVIPIAVLA